MKVLEGVVQLDGKTTYLWLLMGDEADVAGREEYPCVWKTLTDLGFSGSGIFLSHETTA